MDQDQLEAQRLRGQEAEQFLEFLKTDGQYFVKLFEELNNELNTMIAGLDPQNTMAFTVLQAKRLSLYEPLNRVHADVQIGRKAAQELGFLDGTPNTGGIL